MMMIVATWIWFYIIFDDHNVDSGDEYVNSKQVNIFKVNIWRAMEGKK